MDENLDTEGTHSVAPSRRELLKAGLFAAGATMGLPSAAQLVGVVGPALIDKGPNQIPHRRLGRSSQTISILGMGGHHIGDVAIVDDAVSLRQKSCRCKLSRASK